MVFLSVVIRALTPIALSVYLSVYTDVCGVQGERLWCVMILSLTEKAPAIFKPVDRK